MNKRVLILLLVVALSGCTSKEATPDLAPEPTTITLQGIVQDRGVVPIEGAFVTVRDSELNFTTGPDGLFAFADLEDGFYILDATALDHSKATVTHSPGDPFEKLFVLDRNTVDPYHATVPFAGIIECAAEYVIITPSCDTATEYLVDEYGVPLPNGGSVTNDNAEFELDVDVGWQTIVVDVVFDLDSQPVIEALRTVFSGINDPNAVTTYDQYGRFQGGMSYTFRIEPGETYPEGVAPVNGNFTAFRLNVYAQGPGWHAVCDATGEPSTCTLGVGAGIDVKFNLYVTTFYIEPAPSGWSFQA